MPGYKKGDSKSLPLTSSTQVRHLVGPVADDTILAVLETVASVAELEVVASYLQGEGNQVDRLGHSMTGKVAQLYDILTADELYANGER
jgi:hypothetical protein